MVGAVGLASARGVGRCRNHTVVGRVLRVARGTRSGLGRGDRRCTPRFPRCARGIPPVRRSGLARESGGRQPVPRADTSSGRTNGRGVERCNRRTHLACRRPSQHHASIVDCAGARRGRGGVDARREPCRSPSRPGRRGRRSSGTGPGRARGARRSVPRGVRDPRETRGTGGVARRALAGGLARSNRRAGGRTERHGRPWAGLRDGGNRRLERVAASSAAARGQPIAKRRRATGCCWRGSGLDVGR